MNKLRAAFRRFSADRRGLAALEFALIAPLMVLVLFGSVELTELLATNRRAENTTASVADVISRTVLAPTEIPVGAVTAAIGAPLFVYLLRRTM